MVQSVINGTSEELPNKASSEMPNGSSKNQIVVQDISDEEDLSDHSDGMIKLSLINEMRNKAFSEMPNGSSENQTIVQNISDEKDSRLPVEQYIPDGVTKPSLISKMRYKTSDETEDQALSDITETTSQDIPVVKASTKSTSAGMLTKGDSDMLNSSSQSQIIVQDISDEEDLCLPELHGEVTKPSFTNEMRNKTSTSLEINDEASQETTIEASLEIKSGSCDRNIEEDQITSSAEALDSREMTESSSHISFVVGDKQVYCDNDLSDMPLSISQTPADGNGKRVRTSHVLFRNEGVRVYDSSPINSDEDDDEDNSEVLNRPSCQTMSDTTLTKVRSRGDASGQGEDKVDLCDEEEKKVDSTKDHSRGAVCEFVWGRYGSANSCTSSVVRPKDIEDPPSTKDDDIPKPSSSWYNPKDKRQKIISLFEDDNENEDMFDLVNRIPRTAVLSNLQSIITFCKCTINKSENILRRWAKISANPFQVGNNYIPGAFLEEVTRPLTLQTKHHLQEITRLFLQFGTVDELTNLLEEEQEGVIKDIKSNCIKFKPAPQSSIHLVEHYCDFRKTKTGKTAKGRRNELIRLANCMESIKEEEELREEEDSL